MVSSVLTAAEPWLHFHPGGGGQVQGVSFDPHTPGRLFECSDVEGMYVSEDWGATWQSIGREVIHHMVFYVEVDPYDSRTWYAGHLYGVSKSTDAGKTWQTLLGGYASAAIGFDPHAPGHLIAGHSWLIKNAQLPTQAEQPLQETVGERFIMRTPDAGATWERISYTDTSGYKQVYSVTYHPTRPGEVYLGAHAGLFRSLDGGATWVELKAPPLYGNPGTNGATITPDGVHLLVTFGNEAANNVNTTRLFASRLDELVTVGEPAAPLWTDMLAGSVLTDSGGVRQWWAPKVDPRSGRADRGLAGTYKVLLSSFNNTNLHEGTFQTGANGRLTGTFTIAFARPDQRAEFDFDLGWNAIGPNTRQYNYAPLSWDNTPRPAHLSAFGANPRPVIVSNNQQVFLGDANTPLTSWAVLSNEFAGAEGPFRFYRTRGFSSTVNFDMDAYANYWIQGMADNGFFESYDGGESWGTQSVTGSFGPAQANGDAVHIAKPRFPGDSVIALVGTAPGFGGGDDNGAGTLRAKRLEGLPVTNMGPLTWRTIAGAAGGTGGLNGGASGGPRIWYISSHPADSNHVYLGTHNGIYYTNDIRARFDLTGGAFLRIAGFDASVKFGRIYVDPRSSPDRAVLYVKALTAEGNTLHRINRNGASFTVTRIATPTELGTLDDFAYWRLSGDGKEYMAYTDSTANVFLRQRLQGAAAWSAWERILSQEEILKIYRATWWDWAGPTPEGPVQTSMTLTLTGLVGHDDTLQVGSYAAFGKHGYVMLRGVRLPDASWRGQGANNPGDDRRAQTQRWRWSDWSGEYLPNSFEGYMSVPRLWRAKLVEPVPGEFWYGAASRGGGLQVREFVNDPRPDHATADANQ